MRITPLIAIPLLAFATGCNRGQNPAPVADAHSKGANTTDPSAAILSRDAALREIQTIMTARRDAAIERYGPGPVEIDPRGEMLSAADEAPFRERQQDAKRNHHTVAAVRVKAQWYIFDGVIDPPVFSSAVSANLTEADRRDIESRWAKLEIEIWARRRARFGSE